MSRLLVLYVFHDYNDRVEYFIKNAIFYDENIDFIIIANNKDITFDYPEYVKLFVRDNIGYDFGGWSDALLTNDFYKNYDSFIFVNSSVKGPYLKEDFNGRWTDIFINGLKENVKLFGSTINRCIHRNPPISPHVQSYIFSMHKDTLEFLIDKEIFSKTYVKTFNDAIYKKEVLMSRVIIENGWNIGCLMKLYQGCDFTKDHEIKLPRYHDLMLPKYRSVLWDEYEVVFIKGNRGIKI